MVTSARVVRSESEDGDGEYVPEDGISTITELKVDESLKTLFVTCSLGVRGRPGETVMKSTELPW